MMAYAKIVDVMEKQVKVKLNQHSIASSIPYYYIDPYIPKVGDVVVVDTKLHCILGKVVL